jgi:hypothetical protein
LSLNERWLQDRIEEDPSLLSLGDVQALRRDKPEPAGGRSDCVLYNPDQEVRYEVEILLGATEESPCLPGARVSPLSRLPDQENAFVGFLYRERVVG